MSATRHAITHGVGAAALLIAAWSLLEVNLAGATLTGWAALSVGALAGAHAGLGPAVFGKSKGSVSPWARALLAPYLLGLHAARRWAWRNDVPGFSEVIDGVLLGRLPDRRMARALRARGVRCVIDLTAEHGELAVMRGKGYVSLPVLDRVAPDRATLDTACHAIEAGRQAGEVFVHCALGLERSGLTVAWWLWRTGRVGDLAQAVQQVVVARPGGPDASRMLESLERIATAHRRLDEVLS